MDYGTGAIYGVPAHDQRDFEFAKKYDLEILQVIKNKNMDEELTEAFTGEGELINSDFLNGMSVEEAKKCIISKLEELKVLLKDNVFLIQRTKMIALDKLPKTPGYTILPSQDRTQLVGNDRNRGG